MTNVFRGFLLTALLVQIAAQIRAADSDLLPVDPAVILKRLPNGLTYYIRQNKKPENRAQFRLVINAGSILETDKQQGLAHFLEHMAFNGTVHFRKHEIVDFLESIGMQFGADLNAYTSFDETVYQLEIPMDKPEVVKKGVQILEDWAHEITFDPEEIEKERGVVIEEWRLGRGAQGRLRDKQIPVLLHESRYAERLPIGKPNIIRSIERSEFINFYRQWYRPNLMAVIAVGDFDPKAMEALIVEHFTALTNPPDAPKRVSSPVPDHAGTLFSIETDPELSSTTLEIACQHPVSPDGRAIDYRRDLVDGLYSRLLNQRLNERVQDANPPYLYAGVGKSHMVRVKDMAEQVAAVKDGLFAEGLKALLIESRRARRDGFTSSELERAKTQTLRSMERAYEERDKTQSGAYVREYVENFLTDEPIPGIAEELRLTRRFLSEITLAEVDRAGDDWITETNRVILYSAPTKSETKPPSEQDILSVIKQADGVDIAAYNDGVSTAPLLARVPAPGKIISESNHKEVETLEWVLSNGAHVLLKPTTNKNDLILMNAFSPGGHSLVGDKDYISAAMASGIVGQSGLGDYDLIQLRKKLTGKIASVSASIDEQSEELSGSASPKDLETWFQLMYLHFTAPRADEKTFESYLTRIKVGIENRERNPQVVYGDAIEKALYGNHPRHRPMSLELLKELDREAALRIFRDRFADASGFTFVFVGAFKPEELRPYVQTYLASLPALNRREQGRDVGDEPKHGHLNVEVKKGLEPKSSVNIMFHGDAKWSMEERTALRGAVDVLRIRLRELLREDKSGVYGVGVYGNLTRLPKQTYSCGVSFTCSPDNVSDLTQATLDEIKRLQTEGPSAENLEKVRETLLRSFEKGLKEDGFWLSNLAFYRDNELPFAGILKLPDRANNLTASRVRDAARKYFSTENLLIGHLLPEVIKSASGQETK